MKKIFIIVIACIVVALLVGVIWIVITLYPKQPQGQNPQQPGLPTSPQATPVMTVPIPDGGTISTKDFLSDPETKEDSSNPGYYYLGNQPTVANPYLIEYISATHYFNISLEQEPIGQARLDAETYLLEHLGITKDQLCSLDYMVSTPDSVNSIYSDENLGFSFCPGAVALP